MVEVRDIVLLVVEADSGLILADALVSQCFQQISTLVDNNLILLGGVFFVIELVLVAGELLDGEVGPTQGALLAQNVGSLGHATC